MRLEILSLRGWADRPVGDDGVLKFFATLGQIRGQLVQAIEWRGEIVFGEGILPVSGDLILDELRDRCRQALALVDELLEIGAFCEMSGSWAFSFQRIWSDLNVIDKTFSETIVCLHGPGGPYEVCAYDVLRWTLRAVSERKRRIVVSKDELIPANNDGGRHGD